MDLNKTVSVLNRGTGEAGYTLPDNGVRRNWAPGEVKKGISVGELEQATYVPGGLKLMQKYLVINEKDVCEYLGLEIEPEYFYTEEEIRVLLASGTLDQLLDCLDFAPVGVLDLIKKISLDLRLNDVAKREAIKKKLGFDVTAAISNVDYANTSDEDENSQKTGRRAEPIKKKVEEENNTGGRRATPVDNKYKRVSRD